MGKPPAFQLYAADFYVDVAGWSNHDIGAYFRLLMVEWVNGPLPNDQEQLRNIATTGPQKWKKTWQVVSSKFSKNTEGFFVNKRLEKTRAELEQFKENQRMSGFKGVEVKKKKGIFPFNNSSNPLSDPSSDPASGNQALQSSSSLKEKIYKKENKKAKVKTLKMGEFENVKITETELAKLNDKLGIGLTVDYIERLSTYIKQKGKKYKSHYATILSWYRKDQPTEDDKKTDSRYDFTECQGCGATSSNIIKGQPCPYCGVKVK